MPESIKKRDGRLVPYDEAKIASAIDRAFVAAESGKGADEAERLAKIVTREMNAKESNETPSVEDIQDQVEQVLIAEGYAKTAKAYILYRAERSRTREAKTRLMHILEDITFKDASESDVKRENANIDGDTAMGTMLKYGSESAKQFYDMYVLNPEHARAHREGDIHIHDLDFLTLTTTCTQIDLTELFKGGASRRTSAAIPRWRASPSRATRTISTAVRPSPALITTWPPAWRKPISKSIAARWARRWSCC